MGIFPKGYKRTEHTRASVTFLITKLWAFTHYQAISVACAINVLIRHQAPSKTLKCCFTYSTQLPFRSRDISSVTSCSCNDNVRQEKHSFPSCAVITNITIALSRFTHFDSHRFKDSSESMWTLNTTRPIAPKRLYAVPLLQWLVSLIVCLE